jgi:uncharacterized protein (UPF0332 family)
MNRKTDLINYRRSKAKETLRDAKILFGTKSFSSTVNRIYYSLFYETTALLLTKDLSSAKHSGIRSLFNVHFVKTKIVNDNSGKFYSAMFDFRQKGDYGDFTVFEEETISEWLLKADTFLSEIERIIDGVLSK